MLKKIKAKIIFVSVLLFSINSWSAELIKTESVVKYGDGLITMLNKNKIKNSEIQEIVYKTKGSKDLYTLKVGQKFTSYKTKNGNLEKLIIERDKINVYVVSRVDNGFVITKGMLKADEINQYVLGVVKQNLNKTLIEMGLNKEQRKEFVYMFGNTFDFSKIKKGAQLTAVIPEYYVDGKRIKEGNLVSAEVVMNGKSVQVFAFNDFEGNKTYYLKNGTPTIEGIDREPLESYKYISSPFKKARMHPVLGYKRPHKGVDYAANKNTPIYAAASGKIIQKDYQKRGYGNVIAIDHENGYSTLYAHMNKFASGMKNGKRVKKGEIIGYVGTTGVSTGNHLHYEIRKNGVHYDPRTVNLPTGKKISKDQVLAFKETIKEHTQGIALAKKINQNEGKTKVAIRKKVKNNNSI